MDCGKCLNNKECKDRGKIENLNLTYCGVLLECPKYVSLDLTNWTLRTLCELLADKYAMKDKRLVDFMLQEIIEDFFKTALNKKE